MKKIFSLVFIFCIMNVIFAFGEEQKLDDGLYSVNISLWHAYEDKASMGNPSIEAKANIYVNSSHRDIYIGVKPLTFANLTTSLVRFFYADNANKVYKLAGTYVFEIEIPNESAKRPRIFSFPLVEKSEFYNVLIDPKVEQMGDEPIKARLKVDWDSLEKISEEGSLYQAAKNDNTQKPKQKEFSGNDVLVSFSDFIEQSVGISKISRLNLEDRGLKIQPLDIVNGYSIKLKDFEESIPFDNAEDNSQNVEGSFNLTNFDISFLNLEADKVYFSDGKGFVEVDFAKKDNNIELKNAKFGDYALVKLKDDKKESLNVISKEDNTKVQESDKLVLPSTIKPKPQKVVNVKKVQKVNKNENKKTAVKIDEGKTSGYEKNIKGSTDEVGEKAVKKLERIDIILLIAIIYFIFLVSGIILIYKYLPRLMDEIDRKRYISQREASNEK